jgi:capsular exopolysaccharide synthesis family protein
VNTDETTKGSYEASTLGDFLRVVRRRKLIILLATIVVPAVAVFVSMRKPDLYSASAAVLISDQNLAATLAGVPDTSATGDPVRFAATQAFLAGSPQVAQLVVNAAKVPGLTTGAVLSRVNIQPATNTDVLRFGIVEADPALAIKLVNTYAEQFAAYRQQLDVGAVTEAITAIDQQLQSLKGSGQGTSAAYDALLGKEQDLQTVADLEKNNSFVARRASGATLIQPRPKRDGMLGLGLGVVLGLALAFLREATDTRIRSAAEIGERLQLPLVGRLIEPSRRAKAGYDLEVLAEPHGIAAESFRMLRTNIELGNVGHDHRIVMVTSAVEEEGKTTTISNLAVAMARAGRHVILVDLDLRRPAIERFFGLESRLGLTDVALGDITLQQALRPAALGEFEDSVTAPGSLYVLPAGSLPPDAGEWVGNQVVSDILEQLAANADIVLIDTPPILHVGDAMALSAHVDAMLLVVRLSLARRAQLSELRRLLATVPCHKLGFVVTSAEREKGADPGTYLPRAYSHFDRETDLVR